jgi:Ca2+-transporting ATPase
MNIVTDDLPAITLGLNPSSKNIMDEKPKDGGAILTKNAIILLVVVGLIVGILVLGVYYVTYNVLNQSGEIARTVALATLILIEIVNAFSFRSFTKTVLRRSPFVNIYLFFASLVSIIVLLLVVYTPLNKLFQTSPIGLSGWIIILSAVVFFTLLSDLFKIINNKFKIINI